ncbi:hypothetical protein THAOC_01471 [Thalassiosira oceanica]|uniref:Uncharacterized protein n=1 Tax=Thalassiosira oceanica TaxID=159749 RepID=K0TN22_THAOC|nr:hypothetical protein THAOC_01471 [Thalassiosira oceanica]|mmetsp:Transcript_27931/g.63554  ORF Transcript_27931/g.63554 Transcript_27931/m.63554 type:complete len:248 (-) Transcript_27931:49-792(-)|eukprot:EJK76751.1 hypothetical protein THAOC_01471 [Thalassiosira oceanica]
MTNTTIIAQPLQTNTTNAKTIARPHFQAVLSNSPLVNNSTMSSQPALNKRCSPVHDLTATIDMLARQPRKRIRRTISDGSEAGVRFSPNVTVRTIYPSFQESACKPWLTSEEIDQFRLHGKLLCKSHREARLNNGDDGRDQSVSVAETTKFEYRGVPLRGYEHMTDPTRGAKRRQLKIRAIKSVVEAQSEPGCVSDDSTSSLEEDIARNRRRIANVYKKRSIVALAYSRRVAETDAIVAAGILADDL